jgi:hypothetical protein
MATPTQKFLKITVCTLVLITISMSKPMEKKDSSTFNDAVAKPQSQPNASASTPSPTPSPFPIPNLTPSPSSSKTPTPTSSPMPSQPDETVLSKTSNSSDDPQTQSVGNYGVWNLYKTNNKNNGSFCFLSNAPTLVESKVPNREPVRFMVTKRMMAPFPLSAPPPAPPSDDQSMTTLPPPKPTYEISVCMGYPLSQDHIVSLMIDKHKFLMFSKSDWAWLPSSQDDEQLISSLSSTANSMTIKGFFDNTSVTLDTYSLDGFEDAFNALSTCSIDDDLIVKNNVIDSKPSKKPSKKTKKMDKSKLVKTKSIKSKKKFMMRKKKIKNPLSTPTVVKT